MSGGEVRLAVDCGSVTTTAVVVWPDGRWRALSFDGGPVLSSAVFVTAGGRMVCGVPAWQAAARSRDGLFVPAPSRRLGEEEISGNGVTAAGVDVMAVLLRRVAQAAEQAVGGPVPDVRLVVPAMWGPHRSVLLRKAAHRAGLTTVRVVPAPVAVADLLVATGVPVAVGARVAVCDLGGVVEASVLVRRPDGFEVVSVLDDADAGGLRLDERLATGLNGFAAPAAGVVADPGWWQLVLAARIAKEELAVQPAVAVDMPAPLLPVVLTQAAVQVQARPLWERAARLTVEAVENADLQAGELAGVFLAGGGAVVPQAADVTAAVLGRPVQVVPDPGIAAVRGAAGAADDPAAADRVLPVLSWLPDLPLRRLLGVLVPAAASAGLFIQFLTVRSRDPARFERIGPGDGVPGLPNLILNWGQVGMASLLALVACLCGAAVLGVVLPANAGLARPSSSEAVRVGGGLVVAAILGSFIAALLGVGGAVYLNAPTEPFLRWALGSTLPLAVVAAVTGAVAAARGRTPVAGWHTWLHFPILSAVPAAAGMLLLNLVYSYLPVDAGPTESAERFGGFLIGVGAGLALVRPLLYRLVVVPPLAAITTAIVDLHTTGFLASFYVAAVTCWWLQRLWQLLFHPDPWTRDA